MNGDEAGPHDFANAGLGGIADEVDQLDGATVNGKPAAVALPTLFEKNRAFISIGIAGARDFVSVVVGVKSLAITLNDTNVAALADAWAKVAEKHGRDLSQLVGDYGEELAAALVTFGIARQVKIALDAEVAAKRAAAEAAAAAPADEPAAPVAPVVG